MLDKGRQLQHNVVMFYFQYIYMANCCKITKNLTIMDNYLKSVNRGLLVRHDSAIQTILLCHRARAFIGVYNSTGIIK